MKSANETVLQFGAGRFLRAFVDRFIQNANDAGQNIGQVVVVQSTPGKRADLLQRQPDGYHVLVRGYEDEKLVERVERIRSISRAISAPTQWDQALAVAKSPQLRYVVSNATESGYILDPADRVDSAPPQTLPGKLTQVLWQRFQSGSAALTLLPTELIERNGDKLRELVLTQAQSWALPGAFSQWVREQCLWLNSLVDCMVTNPPADHPLAATDALLQHAEPYALWAIEKPGSRPFAFLQHPAVCLVDDLAPYFLRKVRILNGIHTAMVGKFLPKGFVTVQQVLSDGAANRWVRDTIYEEIVPTLAYRLENVAAFADQTYDRLRNPFIRHLLADISLNHKEKVGIRLKPTHDEYLKLFGKPPQRIVEAMAYELPAA
jgi:tagaturonate reductase